MSVRNVKAVLSATSKFECSCLGRNKNIRICYLAFVTISICYKHQNGPCAKLCDIQPGIFNILKWYF